MSETLSLIFYLIAFCSVILLSFIQDEKMMQEGKYSKLLSFIIVAILVVISGARYRVGTDYSNYLSYSNKLANMSIIEYVREGEVEIIFFAICKIAAFVNEPNVMFALMALITVLFAYKGIMEHCGKISLGFALLIYVFVLFPTSFNIIRQCAAVAVIFYAYKYIGDRKLKQYFLFVLFATFIHSTAIIMLPMYLMGGNGVTLKSERGLNINLLKVVLYVVIIGVTIFFQDILSMFSNVNFLADYAMYSDEVSGGNNREIYLKLIIFMSAILFRKELIAYDSRNAIIILFFGIAVIFGFVGFVNPFTKRIALYFDITQVIILSSYIKMAKDKTTKVIFAGLIVTYSIGYFIIGYYIWGQAGIFPYQTIFANAF
ncbi:MAG: EpsG family protein [Bacillota bacterium]